MGEKKERKKKCILRMLLEFVLWMEEENLINLGTQNVNIECMYVVDKIQNMQK